ncbi:QueT transporter family protein [Candidatus Soleaferrea massiliensis]|uniref:QueT transporter family protein n=1 Tax=Candidatus Soleaferrea massiliensis TaxID=1470354 RepID=UPI00058B7D7D|nr:QueT transporter family protein [Candidatus Soleaferrea massiliensis]
MKRNQKLANIVVAAVIAALYATLTLVLAPMAFGPLQMRVSEAFTLLPVLSMSAVWGVTVGCMISNSFGVLLGTNILGPVDILAGSLATLAAALMTRQLRKVRVKGIPILAPLPPILVNAVIIGTELTIALSPDFNLGIFAVNMLQVGLGQLVPCYVLGLILLYVLEKTGLDHRLFGVK